MGAIDPLGLAQALIRCPSVTPADGGALGVLEQALTPVGFRCWRQAFQAPDTARVENLYARWGDGEGPCFAFAGHTDVVPVGDAAAWQPEPFAGEVRDGQLCGRGAADMKAAIACFAAAADRFIARRNGNFTGRIALIITGDEEGPSVNGTKPLLAWMKQQGERLDACVVGEPTNPQALGDMVKIGRRGSMNGTLTVEGVQGHTAYPHLADNAAHRLIAMLHALTQMPLDEGTAHFQPSTLQISTIDIGNPAANVIPGRARAAFNIRFNDRWTSASLKDWIKARLDAVGGRYALDFHVSGESFLTPPGEFSRLVSAAVEKVTGRKPELSTTGGTSDARFIHRHCPIAEFGLVGLTMHKIDERVPLADMAALTDIYQTLLDLYFPAA